MFSLFAVLFVLAPSLAFASEREVPGNVVPDKIEYIVSEKGRLIPVYYFEDPNDAQLFKLQKQETINKTMNMTKTPDVSINALVFSYEEYLGIRPYDYSYVYTRNSSSQTQKWTRTVTRTSTSTTTIDVGGSFKDIFEASVGKSWETSVQFQDTFEIDIPPNKQAEIWTWNEAEYYTFSYRNCGLLGCGSKTYFTAINVTNNFGTDIIITNFRNPGGSY